MTSRTLEQAIVASQSLVAQSTDRLEAALAEHHLTAATAQALWAIDPAQPTPSMKVMAQRLFCNAPNLTFVTNQLSDRGLVERIVDPEDRRSRLIVLTEDGLRVRSAVIEAALATTPLVNLTPEKLDVLVRLLAEALDAPRD